MSRVAIYTGRRLGDYVLCRKDDLAETVINKCKKCGHHEKVVKQDPSNPLNYNLEVICTYKKEKQ